MNRHSTNSSTAPKILQKYNESYKHDLFIQTTQEVQNLQLTMFPAYADERKVTKQCRDLHRLSQQTRL